MTDRWMPPVAPPVQPGGLGRVPLRTETSRTSQGNEQSSFQAVLQASVKAAQQLKVSGHAESRLRERGIQLTESDWNRVQTAVERASQKGARDAYLMVGNVGLVVNVPNRTVITAMEHGSQTIVTNIDSVVVV